MAVTDIVTLDTVAIESATVMNRDCSFAINDLRPISPRDDVIRMFPITIGSWADSMIAPAIDTGAIDIDHTEQTGSCDAPVVSQSLGSCYVTAPDMALYDLETPQLELETLIPEFCKQRNIVMNQELRSLFMPNGMVNPGNPYASNYFRWAYNIVAEAIHLWITEDAVDGDTANTEDRMDGLYTQLAAGWEDAAGGDACGDALNIEQAIDWGVLCGTPAAPQLPDQTTVAGQSVTLWGTAFEVPSGMNLAELLDWLWFTKVRANFTDQYGDVQFEAHVPYGASDTFLRNAACIEPCNVSGDFDSELRARLSGFIERRIARFYPHGEILPFLETRHIPANTMRIGPRTIGGNPTYSLFFKNMNAYFNELMSFGSLYGQGSGLVGNDEPMMKARQDRIGIEAIDNIAFQYDFRKDSHKCMTYSVMAKAGVLAVSRHLWLNIANVDYTTWVTAPTSILTHTT